VVVITLNQNARDNIFLTATEMARLFKEAQTMRGLFRSQNQKHHELSPTVQMSFDANTAKLKEAIESGMNPMSCSTAHKIF